MTYRVSYYTRTGSTITRHTAVFGSLYTATARAVTEHLLHGHAGPVTVWEGPKPVLMPDKVVEIAGRIGVRQ
jgi:hypothetical protein